MKKKNLLIYSSLAFLLLAVIILSVRVSALNHQLYIVESELEDALSEELEDIERFILTLDSSLDDPDQIELLYKNDYPYIMSMDELDPLKVFLHTKYNSLIYSYQVEYNSDNAQMLRDRIHTVNQMTISYIQWIRDEFDIHSDKYGRGYYHNLFIKQDSTFREENQSRLEEIIDFAASGN